MFNGKENKEQNTNDTFYTLKLGKKIFALSWTAIFVIFTYFLYICTIKNIHSNSNI
jgi:hypothetical protein